MAKESTVVALKPAGGPPASLAGKMKEDIGKGTSHAPEDNLVPRIYLLQSGSPQVKKGDPERIEGAEAGDWWLRNSGQPIIKGEEGLEFQPCYFIKEWVEWRPDRGGLAGRHISKPKDAEADVNRPNKFFLPNGNEVTETHNRVGLVLNGGVMQPYIVSFTSTAIAASRQLGALISNKRIDNGVAAAWSFVYRLRTKVRTNNLGSWFTPTIEEIRWVTEEEYEHGRALYMAFESGNKKADDEQSHQGGRNDDEVPF